MDRRLEQALADLDTGDALGIIGSIMSHRAALNLAVAVERHTTDDGFYVGSGGATVIRAALDAFLATLPDTEERNAV